MSTDGPSQAAIQAAGRELALAYTEMASLPPRLAAEAAWWSGGPSVDELERRIRASRGLPASDTPTAA